ncbi:MAG: CorA family divalent cation transporter [Thermodesulfobacteriota bacterium]
MINAIEFDFSTKKDFEVRIEDIKAECDEGHYYWIYLDVEGISNFVDILQRLCPKSAIDNQFLKSDTRELLNLFHDSLHFKLFETCILNGQLVSNPIRVILGKCFIATIYDPDSMVVARMLDMYHDDFLNFSQSPGFLLFEIVDYITNTYQLAYRELEQEIDKLQLNLFENIDDEIFLKVAKSTQQLLDFRSALVSAREVIAILATRKSPFIRETTQPFLESKGSLLNRLSDDLSTQRAVVSDTLNLYMGYVSHKTNSLINRLTIISLIFLPITFLAGVYGMNFDFLPELKWKYSYYVFWSIVFLLVTSSLLFFKLRKWI